MKLKNLTYGLLATAMLASCSDDMNVNGPAANGGENLTTGFIGVTIGMPSDGATRGVNDNFDDGKAEEFEVESAAVIFFKGPEEKGSHFYRAWNVTGAFGNVGTTTDQITSQRVATFPVDFAKEADEKLWAMAVVNFGRVMTVTNGDDKAVVKIGEDTVDEDWTLEQFMALQTEESFYRTDLGVKKGFFMVNIPYSRIQGGMNQPIFTPDGRDFRVLADVDRSKIYETEAEARTNPATEIFVERAVAKVDITTEALTTLAQGLPEGVTIKSVEWLIDNTEPKSYLIRNLQKIDGDFTVNSTPVWAAYASSKFNDPNPNYSNPYYRFIGQLPLKDLAKYRTYYCEDPNADGLDADGNVQLTRLSANPNFLPVGADYPQYCHENTFSVENMNTFNTTCAVIKVTYADAEGNAPTFYTIGLNNKVQFTAENACRLLAVDVITNQKVRDTLKSWYDEHEEEYDNNISTTDLKYATVNAHQFTATNNWMKITFSDNTVPGRMVITNLTLFDGKNGADGEQIAAFTNADDDEKGKTILGELNAVQDIKAHTNGVSYYSVLIKHFGDDYTPWPTPVDAAGKPINTPTTAESYPQYSAPDFLGRYGVVRNNWYSINISKINNFGVPTYGDLHFDKTPDDENEIEEAISCRINILSWAKRQQNEEL